jgi:hypothetical protein
MKIKTILFFIIITPYLSAMDMGNDYPLTGLSCQDFTNLYNSEKETKQSNAISKYVLYDSTDILLEKAAREVFHMSKSYLYQYLYLLILYGIEHSSYYPRSWVGKTVANLIVSGGINSLLSCFLSTQSSTPLESLSRIVIPQAFATSVINQENAKKRVIFDTTYFFLLYGFKCKFLPYLEKIYSDRQEEIFQAKGKKDPRLEACIFTIQTLKKI